MLFYFPSCRNFKLENESPFTTDFALNIIHDLKLQCQDCFSNAHVHSREIILLQHPFHCNIAEGPPELETELLTFTAMMH